eukprot:CAMPEP_0117485648 /NCGR_PEP_ID=MMETSP0784-20121206/15072_1 /TAXON_ID=39447 /ORGANISM="" /LENGTH=251 /DNA_ID=CAMNT_0005280239 /DNA_START=67 /DNA_END=822 /DNA_ORIENTATION=-
MAAFLRAGMQAGSSVAAPLRLTSSGLGRSFVAGRAFPSIPMSLTRTSFHRSFAMSAIVQTPQVSRIAVSALPKLSTAASAVNQGLCKSHPPIGVRTMSTWRLRPYAAAGTQAVVPMSSLSAGFSKVGLSLLVLPWKALPMALAVAPTVWLLPAAYRMIFQNSMRHTTASVFTVILYLVLSFLPVPCFENLFSELTFYGIALASTFFMYTFFPEVLLHDFMFMHYLALFTIPLIPLAFAYMPMFAARSYLFL